MQLDRYIKQEIKKGRKKFDIGFWPDMEVDKDSPNRIKFEVGA